MPSYTYQSRLVHSVNSIGDRGSRSARLREYDDKRGSGKRVSVYSTSNQPIKIVRSFGACICCTQQRDLINGYCDCCRSNGANERQCLNTKEIEA
jgi:hypothetical protein